MFDERLGYDPDEWEECPEQEHFLIFGFFTRFFLSAFAIAFAYFFFRIVEANKNKGKKSEEGDEAVPVTSEVLEEASRRLQDVATAAPEEEYRPPSSADALLQEASQYLSEQVPNGRDNSPRRFVEAAQIAAEDLLSRPTEDVRRQLDDRPAVPPHKDTVVAASYMQEPVVEQQNVPDLFVKRNVEEEVRDMHKQIGDLLPRQDTLEEALRKEAEKQQVKQEPLMDYMPAPHYDEAFQTQSSTPRTPLEIDVTQEKQGSPKISPKISPRTDMSAEDQKALREWEWELAQLEADRLAKLQDQEVGGEESELNSTNILPATHISFHSTTSPIGIVEPPVAQPRLQEVTRHAIRDSDLTDYDISDFHAEGVPPNGEDFIIGAGIETRRTTVDSEEYVKVSHEPIYDEPPRADKPMTSDEARQLLELCQEYDLGNDVVAPAMTFPAPTQHVPTSQREAPKETTVHIGLQQQQHEQQQTVPQQQTVTYQMQQMGGNQIQTGFQPPQGLAPQQQQQQYMGQPPQIGAPHPQIVPQHQQTGYQQHQGTAPQIGVQYQQFGGQHPQMVPQYQQIGVQHIPTGAEADFRVTSAPNEDPKNLATAELFVQDALEYLNQRDVGGVSEGSRRLPSGQASGFVIEEEMLSSHNTQGYRRAPGAVSGDPTSALIRTADVFERVEHDEHDDMTYAPEIQSVEIPPDQLSENSENLLEYFDRTSAVGAEAAPAFGTLTNRQPPPQAPSIVSASAARAVSSSSLASGLSSDGYPRLRKQSSLLSVLGVTSMQEMLLTITSIESLTEAMRKAGLSSTNVIFGIDYTASNKYQGEESFGGRSLHTIHPSIKNPYQQVISVLGRTLSPFTTTGCFPAFGFGDARTGDWSVFPLKQGGHCNTLDEVLKVYNEVTPNVDLSGPTNFAPLIHQAMEICQKSHDYHILVIIADGQVTNERATRRAIVQACQYPLSIIVVGVGDGPWDMMRVFDESLPKRPWDNFHFVEFNEIMKTAVGGAEGDVQFAVQSLLEIPDQYRCICELGLLRGRAPPPRGSEIRREMQS